VISASSQPSQGGLAFATPGDWFAVRLPRESADARRLAAEVTAARPELAPERPRLEGMLASLVEACAALDVLCAYATVLDVPAGPLPASLVVSVPQLGEETLDRVALQMAADSGSVAPPSVDFFDLPAGRTVRIEQFRHWADPAEEHRLVSLVIQYVTHIPGTGQAALLTFSSPAVALAGQLRLLFHQITCTLRFDGAGQES
jgi:hypothetical protein